VAAVWDFQTRRIPNWLTGSLFLVGAIWAVGMRGFSGLGAGMLGCLLLATPFVLLFLFAGGGAADAKLMGALGMWLGVHEGVVVLLAVTIAGACLGLVYTIAKRQSAKVTANLWMMAFALVGVARRQRKLNEAVQLMPANADMLPVPYGVAICAGLCAAAVIVSRGGAIF
jgi:prepilin peptidase CpaA